MTLNRWITLAVLSAATAMLLLGCAMLVMRGIDGGDWTGLLPGLLLGGVAIGLISPALAAIFDHRVAGSADAAAGISDGVNSVLLVSVAVAILAGLLSWPLLGDQRSSGIDEPAVVGESPRE